MSEQAIFSRRQLLKIGSGLSAIALMPRMDVFAAESPLRDTSTLFPTGHPLLDDALHGGLKPGTLTVIIGPRGSGKTAFLQRLAQANGVPDITNIGKGSSDMLSIMRQNGKPVGHLMSNVAEPWTDQENAAIVQDSAAHHAFLHRWFKRTHEILDESGGIFIYSVLGSCDSIPSAPFDWTQIPEYIIALDGTHWKAVKH